MSSAPCGLWSRPRWWSARVVSTESRSPSWLSGWSATSAGPERSRLGEAEALLDPAQRLRRPPVPLAEQAHQGGDEKRPHHRRVEQDADRGADRDLLHEEDGAD